MFRFHCLTHHVASKDSLTLHVFEAKLADVKTTQTGIFLRVGGVVPGVQLVAAKQNCLYHVAALGDLALDTELLLCMWKQMLRPSRCVFLQ